MGRKADKRALKGLAKRVEVLEQAGAAGGQIGCERAAGLYLDLLARALMRTLHGDDGSFHPEHLNEFGLDASPSHFDADLRRSGRDWPTEAETMVGGLRLENVRTLIESILHDRIPGDLIETGVWRGGVVIFMRGVLEARGDRSRVVWVADSFGGLPPPDPERYPADAGDALHTYPQLAIPLEQVKDNFRRYGLLDDRVRFLPGWFRDTLPRAPINRLALLRLDGDMYESTMVALESLYPRVSPGGYVVVDDYALPGCALAVDEFRVRNGISATLHEVDWTGRYWRKGEHEPCASWSG